MVTATAAAAACRGRAGPGRARVRSLPTGSRRDGPQVTVGLASHCGPVTQARRPQLYGHQRPSAKDHDAKTFRVLRFLYTYIRGV